MTEKKNTLLIQKSIMYALFFLTFGIMMIVGTFKDLEIDKALFNYQNPFALFFEKYGMLPEFTIKLFANVILLVSYRKFDDALDIAQSLLPFMEKLREIKPVRIVLIVLYHLLYAAFAYGAFWGSNDLLEFILRGTAGGNLQDLLINGGVPKFFAVLIWTMARCALEALVIFLCSRISKEKLKTLEFMAIAGLLMFEGGNIIGALKEHFHRIRFREMIAYTHGLVNAEGMSYRGDRDLPGEWIETTIFDAYTPWYKVGNDFGIYSEANSFPSGHTAAAAYSLLLPALALKSKKAKIFFIPAFLLTFGYTLTMGITRLVRGAHYMTDVAAGAMIMLGVLMVIMLVMNLIQKRSDKRLNRIYRKRERDKEREPNDD